MTVRPSSGGYPDHRLLIVFSLIFGSLLEVSLVCYVNIFIFKEKSLELFLDNSPPQLLMAQFSTSLS